MTCRFHQQQRCARLRDLRRLDEVFPRDAASGQRYPEHMMALVNL